MSVKESVVSGGNSGLIDAAMLLTSGMTPLHSFLMIFFLLLGVRAFVNPRPFSTVPAAKRALANRSSPAVTIGKLKNTIQVLATPGGALQRVTERDGAEEKSPKSQKLLHVAFTALLDEVLVFSPETFKLHFMNSKAEARLAKMKVKRKRAIFTDILPKESRQVVIEAARNLQKSGLESVAFELSVGGVMTELTLKLIREGGEADYFMAVLRDISTNEPDAKARSGYIATLSHEMRTPLTSIKGAVDLVASGRLGDLPTGALDTLNVAKRNVDRLLNLTNEILDLEKMDTGNLQVEFEAIDIGDLVQEAAQEINGYAREFDVRIVVENLIEDCRIQADRSRLLQVMANLLSNAIKYSDPASVVTIRVEEIAENIRVTVDDEGPGIPEHLQSDLFEPYTQGPQVQSKVASTGLGLSIAKRIVEAHDGEIGVTSIPGKGARFYFLIPKVAKSAEVAA